MIDILGVIFNLFDSMSFFVSMRNFIFSHFVLAVRVLLLLVGDFVIRV
jgi:hypothetical protein